jgi:diacylglycerol O-acyltransferase
LDWVPYDRRPVWIDDAGFNFDYHVRHTSLPRPGRDRQLKDLAGRIVSTKLDRNKPLWELWVVEGVSEDRFAIIAKIHHCMIDGLSGVDLTTILLDVTPGSNVEKAPGWAPRPAPTPTQLAVAETARRSRRAIDALSNFGIAIGEGQELAERAINRSIAALSSLRSGWLTPSDRTPLNPEIGPNRRFDWTELDLEGVKEIKEALGGSVNDTVLAITAGAIRAFLIEERGFDPSHTEFRVMNPVSTRDSSSTRRLGNQVAMWLIDLPIDDPDAASRYRKITGSTLRLKRTNQALGASTLVELSSGTPITLLSLASRFVGPRIRPFNLTVTNIPGPQFPMYLLDSQMLANYPMVPLWGQHGLGLALFSYDGRILWGIQADYDTVPDTGAMVAAIRQSYDELEMLAAAT